VDDDKPVSVDNKTVVLIALKTFESECPKVNEVGEFRVKILLWNQLIRFSKCLLHTLHSMECVFTGCLENKMTV